MGNSESNNSAQSLKTDYTLIRRINDPLYGEGNILQQKSTMENVFAKDITVQDESEFQRNFKKFNNRQKLKCNHLINLIQCFTTEDNQLCGTFYKFSILLEYIPFSLDQLIQNVKKQQTNITEPEIWSFAEAALEGLAFLQKSQIYHQNIKTSTLLISKQRIMKLTDPHIMTNASSYSQVFQNPSLKGIYLSPQLTNALGTKNVNPQYNAFKSDIFSLGMCLLNAGNLEPCDKCYNYPTSQFYVDQMDNCIEQFEKKYSQSLTNLVVLMLQMDEEKRLDPLSLLHQLPLIKKNADDNNSGFKQENVIPQQYQQSVQAPLLQTIQPQQNQTLASPYQKQTLPPQRQQLDGGVNPSRPDDMNMMVDDFEFPNDTLLQPSQFDENLQDSKNDHSEKEPQFEQKNFTSNNYQNIRDNSPLYQQQLPNLNQQNAFAYKFLDEKENFTKPNQDLKPFQNDFLLDQKRPDYNIPQQNITKPYDNIAQSRNDQDIINRLLPQYNPQPQSQYTLTQQNPNLNLFPNAVLPGPNQHTNSNQFNNKYDIKPLSYEPAPLSNQPNSNLIQNNFLPYQDNTYNSNQFNNQILPVQNQNQQNSSKFNNPGFLLPQYVVEEYQNGSKYEGEKQNGMRNGRGKFYYQDGGMYDGDWKNNKMHGKGTLFYASGTPAYDGDWIEDKFQGFGVLYNENPQNFYYDFDYTDFDNVEDFWTKYEGMFYDDNKEGTGTLYLTNNERYHGQFSKDFVNGSGTFYKRNGSAIKGVWGSNKLIS